jgi:PAS domain S-box-containing protein
MADVREPERSPTAPRQPPVTSEGPTGFAWAIIELAPDGILVSDDDGRIVTANKQVEVLFGYERDTLMGKPVEILLPSRTREAHKAHRADYATAPMTRPMGAGLKLFGRHADGSEFPIEISLSPVAADHGIATVVVIRDVSQQRDLERAAQAGFALDDHERIAAELHDRVIGHLFASALTLASILGRNTLDDHITDRLRDVIDELDEATRAIRNTVFDHVSHRCDTKRAV